MRKYTIISSDFGSCPLSGYVTEIIKTISHLDGLNVTGFLILLNMKLSIIEEQEDGELFFFINSDFEEFSPFDYEIYNVERALTASRQDQKDYSRTRYFRLFHIDEEWGLEELKLLT